MEGEEKKLDMYERFSCAIAILFLFPAIIRHGFIMGCIRAFMVLFLFLLLRKLFYWVLSGKD